MLIYEIITTSSSCTAMVRVRTVPPLSYNESVGIAPPSIENGVFDLDDDSGFRDNPSAKIRSFPVACDRHVTRPFSKGRVSCFRTYARRCILFAGRSGVNIPLSFSPRYQTRFPSPAV